MSTITFAPDKAGHLKAEEIYNFFMEHREPDLVTSRRSTLHDKYINESQAEKVARGDRYKKALLEFREFFDGFMMQFKQAVSSGNRDQLQRMEEESRALELEQLEALENFFSEPN